MTKPLYTAPNPLNLTLKTLILTTPEVLLFTKHIIMTELSLTLIERLRLTRIGQGSMLTGQTPTWE